MAKDMTTPYRSLSEIMSDGKQGTGVTIDVQHLIPLIDYLAEHRHQRDILSGGSYKAEEFQSSTVQLLDVLRGILAERWYV